MSEPPDTDPAPPPGEHEDTWPGTPAALLALRQRIEGLLERHEALLPVAQTAADAGLDCQARLSRVERHLARQRVSATLPWAALVVSVIALLAAATACGVVLR